MNAETAILALIHDAGGRGRDRADCETYAALFGFDAAAVGQAIAVLAAEGEILPGGMGEGRWVAK